MFLNKSHTPLVLLLVSGVILIVVSYFIINQKKPVVNEGFKIGKKKHSLSNSKGSKGGKKAPALYPPPHRNALVASTISASQRKASPLIISADDRDKDGNTNHIDWIITEDEYHSEKVREEDVRHSKTKGKMHLETKAIRRQLNQLIKQDPDFIEEIGEVISDAKISDKLDKTLTSKPSLKRVHGIIATPQITHQIEDIIHEAPVAKKVEQLPKELNRMKQDIKKDMTDQIEVIRNEIKQLSKDAARKVDKAVKKTELQVSSAVKSSLPVESPYDKLLKAYNKLSELNSSVVDKKRKELLEIRELRKQIEEMGVMMKNNSDETSKLEASIEAIRIKKDKAAKDLDNRKTLFKDLVKHNLAVTDKLRSLKGDASKDKSKCDDHKSEVKRLSIRLESTNSEKKSADEQIKNMKDQLKAAQDNESLANVLKGQISQLEKVKIELEKNAAELKKELDKEMEAESLLKAKVQKAESQILALEADNKKMDGQIADTDAKNKLEQASVSNFTKLIAEAKDKITVRKNTNTQLTNELANLQKQYDAMSTKETDEERQLANLENDAATNQKKIAELQITIKSIQTKPKNYPIGNWDFTTGKLKDKNEKYQSETFGNVPIETIGGKTAARFNGAANYIKITGGINTNDFKTITMMFYVFGNPGPWPRLWEATNGQIGSGWCDDNIFGVLNPSNNLGFYSKKGCGGPEFWSNRGNMPLNTWHHAAFVYGEKMDEMTLYYNGVNVGHWAENNNRTFANKNYSNFFIMQSVENFNKNVAVAWFRIFDYVMTPADVMKDMGNEWS